MIATHRSEKAAGGVGRRSLGVILLVLASGAGCSTLRVETLPAPGADLGGRTTFRMTGEPAEARTVRLISLDDPEVRAVEVESTVEPMLNNSIMDDIVRYDIQRAFEGRGYSMTTGDADLEIAYHVQARERRELEDCDRRHYYRYRSCRVDEFTEGTVVIDVRDPATEELLWRGSGVAEVSDDPQKYQEQMREAISEIVSRFPAANYAPATAPSSPSGESM
ncbi:MAG: DUF4136 domain-containing protein [Gemmatimonas sp.]|nr:DUF4136 domain-containing protein [Gemmatimonas sp.]